MNPRQAVRDLAKGQALHQPLTIPLVFALAAKVEGIPLPAFLSNPTKLANSLKHVYDFLRPDGLVCYFDTCFEAEALGCQLDWTNYPPTIISSPYGTGKWSAIELESLQRKGRIPVALEVTRRIRVMLRDQAALVVGTTGPGALANQLFGAEIIAQIEEGRLRADDVLEQCGRVALQVAQWHCEAGADIIFILEEVPGVLPPRYAYALESVLSPLCNVIRFHETLPVLYPRFNAKAQDVEQLFGLAESALLCLGVQDISESKGIVTDHDKPFALAVPVDGSDSNDEVNECRQTLTDILEARQCALLTTEDEVPYDLDVGQLEWLAKRLRSLATEGAQ
jgi:hypothetical protein